MPLIVCDSQQKDTNKKEESGLSKAVKDRSVMPSCIDTSAETSANSDKIATEAQHGLIAQVLKDVIFSSRLGNPASSSNVADIVDTAMSIG